MLVLTCLMYHEALLAFGADTLETAEPGTGAIAINCMPNQLELIYGANQARNNDTSARPTSLYWEQLPENLEGENNFSHMIALLANPLRYT